jgi:hypothetical protein
LDGPGIDEKGKLNITMKGDVDRKGFVFVSKMTFPFDMAILNIKLRWKNLMRR